MQKNDRREQAGRHIAKVYDFVESIQFAGVLEPVLGAAAEPDHRASVVPGAVQVRFDFAARRSAHLAPVGVDRGRWAASPVEGRLSSRPEHTTQLLAVLLRQPSGGGPRLPRLALEDARYGLRMDEAILPAFRTERPHDRRSQRTPDWRLAPIHALGHYFGVAGTALLPALEVQRGSGIPAAEGLSLSARHLRVHRRLHRYKRS